MSPTVQALYAQCSDFTPYVRRQTLYKKEVQMYPDVMKWLKEKLTDTYRKKHVIVLDTSQQLLSSALLQNKLHGMFPQYQTYEVHADITGIVYDDHSSMIILVECKLDRINLIELSQLIGYCKVVKPSMAYILSPAGAGPAIKMLFDVYKRLDVLYYENSSGFIRIASWDENKKDIDYSCIIPPGTT